MYLDPGTRVGPYQITGVLGEGGMGVVYRAHDERLSRDVAIKFLSEQLASDPARARAMQQEARAASKLNHPNIVAVFDVGTHEELPYVVTELLEGESLAAIVARGKTPWRTAHAWAMQLAEGLAVAHEHGIVHRDIKPDNVFVMHDGRVKILDFGVATLRGPLEAQAPSGDAVTVSQAGLLVGTVGYMSPEQTRGQKVDHRADIFAFGCVLYEIVSSKRAFAGSAPVDVLAAIARDAPTPLEELVPELRSDAVRLIERCLEKDPAKRFQSARDLVFALSLLDTARRPGIDGGVSGSSPGAPLPTSQPSTNAPAPTLSRRALFWVAAALAADTAITFGLSRRSRPAAQPAPTTPSSSASASRAAAPVLFRQVTFRRGTVYTARFSHDGRDIIYSAAWEGRPRELFLTVPGTRDTRALAMPETDAAFVTDASEVHVIRRSAPGFSSGVLARASLAGGPAKDLVDGVRWADAVVAGGDWVVIRRVDGKPTLEMPLGHVLAQGKPMAYPRMSPDAAHVAFLEYVVPGEDTGRMVVVDRAGKRVLETPNYKSIEGLAWRTSSELWFTASMETRTLSMWATDLVGNTRLLTRAPGRLVLHDLYSDGRVVAERNSYRCNLRVGVISGAGATEKAVEQDLAWQDFSQLAQVSADGKQLLFSEEGGTDSTIVAYLRPTDGGAPLRLGEGFALALSPDGKQALVRIGQSDVHLELLPVGVGRAVSLPKGTLAAVSWARFAKGGSRVVLLANEAGKPERLFVQDLPGGEPKPLTSEGCAASGDAVSPDGATIAVTLAGKPVLIDIEAGTQRPIVGLDDKHQPVGWSADAQSLFVSTESGLGLSIERFDVVTKKLTPWRTLAPTDLAGVLGGGRVSISASGNAYAYESYQLLSDLFVIENLK